MSFGWSPTGTFVNPGKSTSVSVTTLGEKMRRLIGTGDMPLSLQYRRKSRHPRQRTHLRSCQSSAPYHAQSRLVSSRSHETFVLVSVEIRPIRPGWLRCFALLRSRFSPVDDVSVAIPRGVSSLFQNLLVGNLAPLYSAKR